MDTKVSVQQAKVAILWNRGFTIEVIANSLFMPVNTAASELRRVREKLGIDCVPHRSNAGRLLGRPPSILDELTEPGQQVRGSKEELGGRTNIYQNAETRGWAVRVESDGDGWLVTALNRVPHRAVLRSRAAPKGTAPQP